MQHARPGGKAYVGIMPNEPICLEPSGMFSLIAKVIIKDPILHKSIAAGSIWMVKKKKF